MKKSFYLLGSVLAIALIGIVLLSGCTRSSGNTGGTAVNSNSSQSSSETQNTTTQQSTSSSGAKSNGGTKATVSDGVQTVTTTLERGYAPIVVQTGIPVKWTITAENGDLSGCNNKMLIRSYGVEQKLNVGENVVEFTPTKSGTIQYSCWMGMVGSTITVVDDINQ
ncbi:MULTISPECIES: hypothetical protein [Acetobacterium]|jgi:type II secretory pathway pseudopilin PulG|uniref:hypothetical protein n=1 Tax=Acetobacterium TaxID=33951 RepID=UPI0003FFA9C5|nr:MULTISPECIES: hypothetical protein [Acetobacterium]MBU4541186.1 hypothetical protein [Bacillota bacterium]